MRVTKRKTNHLKMAALLSAGLLTCGTAMFAATGPESTGAAAISNSTQQQGDKITGTVVDEKGDPVIGASVLIKGTRRGTVTDVNGNFTLNVKPGTRLAISSIGYKDTELTAAAGRKLKVVLKENSHNLDDVVVVGFGTQKKVNLTGAVGVASAEDLKERPVSSAAQALQGLVAGLQISNSNGSLDTDAGINIRGTTTLGQGTSGSPLVLIDGMEGDINTINPQDIESVSVLKDAAASSIYGSRAPFGVVLVTTKSGRNSGGKVTLNYNNNFRFSTPIRRKSQMNSVDFASLVNNAQVNSGSGPYFSLDRIKEMQAYRAATPVGPGQRRAADGTILYSLPVSPYDPNVWADANVYGIDDIDYYDVFYKDWTFSQEHNFSASGGNEKYNYYASFNYLGQDGLLKIGNDNMNRFTATGKISSQLTKWMRFNYTYRFGRKDYDSPGNLGDYFYNFVGSLWPVSPLYDRNGHYYQSQAIAMSSGGSWKWQYDESYHQAEMVFEPIKDWVTHVQFNYRIQTGNTHSDYKNQYTYDVNEQPVNTYPYSGVSEGNTKENYYNFQAFSEYTKTVAKKHNFHLLAGFQAEDLKQQGLSAGRDGIIAQNKPEIDLTTGLDYEGNEVTPSVSGYHNRWTTAGFFGRLNYDYDHKYLLEVNGRYDGSSRFRPGNQWKFFPSVSVGWNIASEKFMEPLHSVVDQLKLRVSYGNLGNQNTSNWYQTYQTISVQAAAGTWMQNGNFTNVAWAPGIISETLSWENIETYNYGVDFGFFNNRLSGSFDYYIRNTKDMVGNAPELPAILGTAVPVTNNTDLQTKGWELTIGWKDRLANGLSYGVKFNVSDSRSKVTRYPNNPTQSISNYIVGQQLGDIYGFVTEGIAKTDEEMKEHIAKVDQSALGSNWGAGDIMYKDLNGDGQISWGAWTLNDHGDQKIIGNSTPRYQFGIDVNAAWKGFDLRVFFQGVMKRDYWTDSRYMFGTYGYGMWYTTPITDVADYFRDASTWSVENGLQSENLNAYYPRPTYTDKNIQRQTRYLQDASYIRLKNLQIGYTLPHTLMGKLGIESLRVFFSGENLWTGTKLAKQFDPETIGYNYGNGYPLQATVSFGLNVTF